MKESFIIYAEIQRPVVLILIFSFKLKRKILYIVLFVLTTTLGKQKYIIIMYNGKKTTIIRQRCCLRRYLIFHKFACSKPFFCENIKSAAAAAINLNNKNSISLFIAAF